MLMKITEEILKQLARASYIDGQVDGIAGRHTEFEESLAKVALDTILKMLKDKK